MNQVTRRAASIDLRDSVPGARRSAWVQTDSILMNPVAGASSDAELYALG